MACLDYYDPNTYPWAHGLLVCYPARASTTTIDNAILSVGSSTGTYSTRGGLSYVWPGPPPQTTYIATRNNFNGGIAPEYAKAVWTALKNAGLDSVVTGIIQNGVDVPKLPPPTCTEGAIVVLEYCPAPYGSTWKRRNRCVSGSWVEESQTCPTVPTYTPSISVSPTTIQAGGTFTATGSGFNPALPIDLRVTDLYGNLLAIYSKSPAANGTVTFSNLVLPSGITYSGTGDVYGRQSDGSESNHVQVSISAAQVVQHRYYTRYVRIDSGTLPAYVRFYIQDLDAGIYIAQETLTLATLGKKLCFKGSGDVYDSHHIRVSVKNEGTGTISVTYGLAWNANAAISSNAPSLTPGTETSRIDVSTWAAFSASDFDFTGCEGVGPLPPGSDCDAKFPNRQTNMWEMIGWGVCVGVNAVWGAIQPVFQPIFDNISKMLSPFLQPFLDATQTLIGIGTAMADWIKDPWTPLKAALAPLIATIETPLKAYWNWVIEKNTEFFKPLTDALGVAQQDFSVFTGILTNWIKSIVPESIKTAEAWAKDPMGEALKLAPSLGAGLYDAMEKVLRVTDPVAELFDPDNFRSEEIQAIATRIHDVLGQGEFTIIQLVTAFIFAPWLSLYTALERLLLGTEPATYENAKTRAATLTMLQVDIAALIAGLEVLTSILPAAIRILDKIPAGVRGLIASVMVLRNVSDIMGPAVQHGIKTPLERQWRTIALDSRPDVGELLSLRSEGHITVTEYKDRMAEQGYSQALAELLYKSFLREPNYREIATLYRRGKISQTAFANLREVARLSPEYGQLDPDSGKTGSGGIDAWLEGIWNDPSWRQLNVMATSGKLSDDELEDLVRAQGTRPEYQAKMIEVLKELPGATQRRQVLTLEARLVALGRLDEATYDHDAQDLKISDTVAGLILRAERLRIETGADVTEREASIGSLNTWYRNDIIDAATYRQDAQALAYSDTYITRQLAYLDKQKLPPEQVITEREATRAMWDTWYLEDIVSRDEYTAGLEALDYPLETVSRQLALLEKRKTPPITDGDGGLETERDLLQSEATAAFKKHVIDEAEFRLRLDKLGRSQDAIEVLVAIAKADMAVESRDASQAIYSKAYRQGAIDRPTYTAWLTSQEYTSEAANLIIQTEEQSWASGVETLTQTQILNSWELGFLDDEQVQKRLKAAGLTDADMRILLSNSVLDQLKAKHLTSAEADKKWTDFGIGPEARAKLVQWYGWTPT